MRGGVALAFLLMCARAHAQAGPPMITNDPDTPGPGVWEINVAATGDRLRGGGWDLDAPDLDINRGVGERIQLSVHAAWAHARDDGAWRSGLGDVEFGMRYRFLDAESDRVSLAVQPLYVRGWSAAARRRGLASEHPEWVLPLQLARPFGSFSGGLEVARHFISKEADAWQLGTFVAHDCAGGDCLAEINATRVDGQSTRTIANVGARHPLREGLLLMGSLGTEVSGPDRAPLVFYVGLQYVR
ncbi:hypothetical protein [Cognatilysobacter terrigena]|uniref:hypothetical protein n=1 Tax=Cognatilysobacter terrigena TaxID=2488749 RepID=UPI00105C03BE|nr:hypothetical protein [Lysobacter terrigena]